jgi:hypothetical protein
LTVGWTAHSFRPDKEEMVLGYSNGRVGYY